MRTVLFLLSGFFFLAGFFLVARLMSVNYPSAMFVATTSFVAFWLALTGFNMWVGVVKAGYSVGEELPVFLILFGVPALIAVGLKWKFF